MSITISTDVFCDGDGCAQWVVGVTGNRPHARVARKVAKSKGWKITTRKDLCPHCLKLEKAT